MITIKQLRKLQNSIIHVNIHLAWLLNILDQPYNTIKEQDVSGVITMQNYRPGDNQQNSTASVHISWTISAENWGGQVNTQERSGKREFIVRQHEGDQYTNVDASYVETFSNNETKYSASFSGLKLSTEHRYDIVSQNGYF